MHIALCHNAIIPPRDYGGTERVVAWLARALLEKGHKVSLVAKPGSEIEGAQLIVCDPKASWDKLAPKDADLLHLWATPSVEPSRPYVVNIGGNGQPGEVFLKNSIFVSRSHAARHGSSHFVYNGLPIDDYACDAVREPFLVFLAKASWKVKNLKGAIEVARGAGLRLEVLGSRNWPFGIQKLFPPLNGVHYRGMVGETEKRRLLRKASGLLFPVRWEEPFGLAVTEALASGCPVFGTPYGSLPEIVTPEVGVLSTSSAALVEAIKRRVQFSPEVCRARVRQGYTHLQMADGYLEYYSNVLKTGELSEGSSKVVQTKPGFVAEELLPWN